MGLIKTAILTSGGIYAVNKIAKTTERTHASSSNTMGYPPQGYQGPPPTRQQDSYSQPPYSQNQFSNRGLGESGNAAASASAPNNEYPPQGYWVPLPAPPGWNQQPQSMQDQRSTDGPGAYDRRQTQLLNSPPPYDPALQQRGVAGNDLLGKAMDFVASQEKDSKLSRAFK